MTDTAKCLRATKIGPEVWPFRPDDNEVGRQAASDGFQDRLVPQHGVAGYEQSCVAGGEDRLIPSDGSLLFSA